MKTINRTAALRAAAILAPLLLAACGGGGSATGNTAGAATDAPRDKLAEINRAYSGNAIAAKREWGGKRVTVGGAFYSSGRNPDGTTSVLLNPGTVPPTLGEMNVGRGNDDFVAKLKKDDAVAMDCTVDPKNEGFAASYVDCAPAGAGK